jgi:ribose-phosphate pyrophosphokinase
MIINIFNTNTGNWRKIKPEYLTFPDGQPHVKVDVKDGDRLAFVECSIRNPAELFNFNLVMSVLEESGIPIDKTQVDIYWLFGARMDRPIDSQQPNTFKIVKQCLRWYKEFTYLLDIHNKSEAIGFQESLNLLEGILTRVEHDFGNSDIYFPDAGAQKRYSGLFSPNDYNILTGKKKRDSQTGKLSGFELSSGTRQSDSVLIIDDLADGCGTFLGQYDVLKSLGYNRIGLYTTHGLYTKGLDILTKFDTIYSTNSFQFGQGEDNDQLKVNVYKDGKLNKTIAI